MLSGVKIVKIINNLKANSKTVVLNFIYANSIIGELLIRFKTPTTPIAYSHNFLLDLVFADSIGEFNQHILVHMNKLA